MSEPEATGAVRFHRRYLALAGACVIVATWLRPAFSSLWLDELGTWWVIKDGLGDAVDRALEYHGQAPTYYVIEWVVAQAVGRSEFGLRIPSLVAMAVAAWLLFRLVSTLVGREAGRLAVLGFVGLEGVAFASSDARPYALATMFLVATALALVRWLARGGVGRGVVFVILAIATVWSHYAFAVGLIPLAIYGYARARSSSVRPWMLTTGWLGVGLGLLPLVSQLASLAARRYELSPPAEASIEAYLLFVVPPVLAGGLLLGLSLARALGSVSFEPRSATPDTLLLLISWLVLPPAVLIATSIVAEVNLLSPRYYLSAAPAAAALFGWALATVEPASTRRTTIVAFAILAILAAGGQTKNEEDWRGAARTERALADDATLVFLHPALVESAQIDWLEDPTRASYLSSPASFYDMDGELVPMPYLLEGEDAYAYLERVTDRELDGRDRFLLVTRYPFVPFTEWWDGRLSPQGWTWRTVGGFGVIRVIEFTKDGASRSPG